LSLEASDKIDPNKRISPANRELFAQGTGNVFSGLFGGLPVTAVIVRSSANANAGAQTKLSAILHGVWLITVVALFPNLLNMIPNAALSAILIFVGYKLAKPSLFKSEYRRGWGAFLPFLITVIAILLTDLLLGIAIGMIVGFYFIIKTNFHRSITVVSLDNTHLIRFYYQATFLNKSLLKEKLAHLPQGAEVILDFTNCHFVDNDIRDIIEDFEAVAEDRNLKVSKKFTSESHQLRLMKIKAN
jgi:MFS superfamily sulfate permease-like transporter